MQPIRKLTLAAAALAVTLTGTAFASPEHGGEGKQGCMHGEMRHGGGMMHGKGARMEERLTTIKTELKLTQKQEPAWAAFEQAVRSQKAGHQKGHARGEGDMLEGRIAGMEERLNGMKAVLKAREDLYKTLTPEQKATAEKLFRGPHA